MSEDKNLKIADFGLARILTSAATVSTCGTPSYMAPEIGHNNNYSLEADIW